MADVNAETKYYVTKAIAKARDKAIKNSAYLCTVISLLVAFLLGLGLIQLTDRGIETAIDDWVRNSAQAEISSRVTAEFEEFIRDLETMKKAAETHAKHVEQIQQTTQERSVSVESIASDIKATLTEKPLVVIRSYDIDLPAEYGSTLYESGISPSEYPAAIIGGWQLLPTRSSGQVKSCTYNDVSSVVMQYEPSMWQINVHKTDGCERLRVRIFFIPKQYTSYNGKWVSPSAASK